MSGDPEIGRIYADSEWPGFHPEWSARRLRLDQLVSEALDADPFDDRVSSSVRAVQKVLDLHKPWLFFKQIFNPYYVGIRYLGVGCRACGMDSADDLNKFGFDCWTVREVAEIFGIKSELDGSLHETKKSKGRQ